MAIFDLHKPGVFAFGILGNIVSIFVFLAPLPTFIRICRTKSTMGFQSLPYVVALFSCMLWMYYAMLKVDAFLLISINAIGCVVEIVYITIYLIYATKDARKHTVRVVAGLNIGLFSMIFLGTVFSTQGPLRVAVVGWICVAVSVSVFAAPLSIVFQVVRTKSVEFMPFLLSFFLTLSAVMWFAYGLLLQDLHVALPNVFGFLLGVLQMLLYGIYRNGKKVVLEPEDKVPEHVINIVKISNPEVHPVDSPVISVGSDKKEVETDQEEEQENKKDNRQTWHKDDDDDEEEKCVSGLGPDQEDDERLSPIVNVKPIESPVLIMCTA